MSKILEFFNLEINWELKPKISELRNWLTDAIQNFRI